MYVEYRKGPYLLGQVFGRPKEIGSKSYYLEGPNGYGPSPSHLNTCRRNRWKSSVHSTPASFIARILIYLTKSTTKVCESLHEASVFNKQTKFHVHKSESFALFLSLARAIKYKHTEVSAMAATISQLSCFAAVNGGVSLRRRLLLASPSLRCSNKVLR